MKKSTNTLIITTTELAKKSKVSRQTVSDTLKILEESQIIARKTGAIMIHSNLVHRGNHSKEKYLLARFQEWGKDDEIGRASCRERVKNMERGGSSEKNTENTRSRRS